MGPEGPVRPSDASPESATTDQWLESEVLEPWPELGSEGPDPLAFESAGPDLAPRVPSSQVGHDPADAPRLTLAARGLALLGAEGFSCAFAVWCLRAGP